MERVKEHLRDYKMLYAGVGTGFLLFLIVYMITRGGSITRAGIPTKPPGLPALDDMPAEVWQQLLNVVQLNNK